MHPSLGGVSRRHDPPSPPSPETGWAALESRSRCSGLSGRGAATVKSRARWLASTVRGPACERLYKEGADPSGLRASRGLSAHATTSPLPIEHALGGSVQTLQCPLRVWPASVCNRRPTIAAGRRRLLVPHRARASSPPGGRQLTTQTQTQTVDPGPRARYSLSQS